VSAGRLALLWAGAFTVLLSFFLLLSALPLYAQQLGLTGPEIGVVMAAFALSSMLLRPWAGWAADRHGRRPLMLAGAAVFVLAPLAYAASTAAASLAAVRLFHGAGMGLYPTAATAMAADVAPPARRAEVLGVFGMAGSLALALGPATGIALVRALGFVPLFAIATAVALLGLSMTAGVRETLTARGRAPLRLTTTISRAALFPSLLVLGLMLTYGALITVLPLHADAHGVNPGLFFLVYALALTAVRPPAGRLSDRRGRAPVSAGGLFIVAAALVVVALGDGSTGLVLAGLLYGIGHGTAQPALVAWCVDHVGAGERGRAMGTFYTALELGIAIGAIASGIAVARVGFMASFLGAAAVASAVALLAVSGPAARHPGTWHGPPAA
jgi:MFS family permease